LAIGTRIAGNPGYAGFANVAAAGTRCAPRTGVTASTAGTTAARGRTIPAVTARAPVAACASITWFSAFGDSSTGTSRATGTAC
jgi:hypothetical protein